MDEYMDIEDCIIEDVISNYDDLKALVSDELDKQIGLDSSDFSIYLRHDTPAIRLYTKRSEKECPTDLECSRKEWIDVGDDLVDRLEREGFGDWYVNSCCGRNVELWKETV